MIDPLLQDHPGWQWCTAEGAELHTLIMGLQTSLREKIQWLEDAEELSIRFQAKREKILVEQVGGQIAFPNVLCCDVRKNLFIS